YCVIGGGVNIIVSLVASRLIDGPQAEWSAYSIPGQQREFREKGLPEMENGWYLVPGKIDRVSWWLLAFFVFTIVFLYAFEALI
ncbi:MAG: sodium transporter, partial [Pseudomonadota bacterium]